MTNIKTIIKTRSVKKKFGIFWKLVLVVRQFWKISVLLSEKILKVFNRTKVVSFVRFPWDVLCRARVKSIKETKTEICKNVAQREGKGKEFDHKIKIK